MVCVGTPAASVAYPMRMTPLHDLTLHRGSRSSVAAMEIQLLYFEDCPNWRLADERLTAIAAERSDIRLTHHLVETPAEAERTRFHGSPHHPGRRCGRTHARTAAAGPDRCVSGSRPSD